MKKTTKLVLMSVLTIAMCVSLIAGATFALFTSESSVNIAVSSGKVDVVATITDLEYASNSASRDYDGKWIEATQVGSVWSGTFENSGVVTYDESTNQFNINGITPGDAVRFNITISNKSTVNVKYQTSVTRSADSHAGLFGALEIAFGGDEMITVGISGTNKCSVWKAMELDEVIVVPVTIELPYDVDDKIVNGEVTEESIQGKTCDLEFVVSAVQSNASTTDPDANPDYVAIYTAEDLKFFRDKVNGGENYYRKTVKMMANIDLQDEQWTPIGNSNGTPFRGYFDGNGFAIKNLNVCGGESIYWGLFGRMYGSENVNQFASISNLKIDGAKIGAGYFTATSRKGTLLGSGQYVSIKNVQITGLDIPSTSEGNYLGGLVGHGVAVFAEGCYIQGSIAMAVAAQAGGLYGYCSVSEITNCRLDIKVNGLHTSWFGGIVGNYSYDNSSLWKNAISGCYVNIEMTNSDGPMKVGGIAAHINGSVAKDTRVAITNCYVTGSFDGYFSNSAGGIYGAEDVRSGLGGLCGGGYGIDFDNCFVNMDVPGGMYLVTNCSGDYGTAEVWNVTNCSWKGGADSYTYYGYQNAPSYVYGTIEKSADCSLTADMSYDDFIACIK